MHWQPKTLTEALDSSELAFILLTLSGLVSLCYWMICTRWLRQAATSKGRERRIWVTAGLMLAFCGTERFGYLLLLLWCPQCAVAVRVVALIGLLLSAALYYADTLGTTFAVEDHTTNAADVLSRRKPTDTLTDRDVATLMRLLVAESIRRNHRADGPKDDQPVV